MVKVKLKHGSRLIYTHMINGDPGSAVTTNGNVILHINRVYQIPVDTTESLDQHNLFKPIGKVNEVLNIRNIENGIACIVPIVNGVVIKDNQDLGKFI